MRKALILVSLLALVAGALPANAGPNGPNKDFRMFGGGWGHGLGMSQWGAYGLAKDGWSANKILKHYYSGTQVGVAEQPPKDLRIGLVQGEDSVRLEAQDGDLELRLSNPESGTLVATIAPGQTWKVKAAGNNYRILDDSGTLVEQTGGPSNQLFVVYEPAGSRVRVPEAFHTYNRGSIEFDLYACTNNDCVMRLVLTLPPQDYLYGLAEVPSSWPVAALRAQAIAARSYAFTKAANSQHRPVCDCALYASSFDQVYAGWDKESGLDGERWVSAVDDTDDEVVLAAGETIQAFYMSSSGGYTENNENVWGGTPISYLRGVCDPGDYTTANPNATWEEIFTPGQVSKELGLGIGTVTNFANVVRGVSGRILTVTVMGANGQSSISGNTLQSLLSLNDDRVWINADRLEEGEIREKYDALG
ncbi:MAG: SpoIID/LytB domain-containing protein, partial [Actinomycetota bacterium]